MKISALSINNLWNETVSLFEQGYYNDALRVLNMDLNWNKNSSFYSIRGCSKVQLGRYSEAISDFLKQIEFDPSDPNGYLNISEAYIMNGNYNDALSYSLSAFHYSNEDKDKAISLYLRCVSMKLVGSDPISIETELIQILTSTDFNLGSWSFTPFVNWLNKTKILDTDKIYMQILTDKLNEKK